MAAIPPADCLATRRPARAALDQPRLTTTLLTGAQLTALAPGCGCACADDAEPPAPPAPPVAIAPAAVRYRIANLDCAAEVAEIRLALDKLPGVRHLDFDLRARQLSIEADEPTRVAALAAIRKAGFQPEVLPAEAPTATAASHWEHWGRLLAALALAAVAELLSVLNPARELLLQLPGMALAALAIALAGHSVYGKGLAALRHGRLNINALMTVAVTGAFLIGQWPEAAMVMALYALAETIEARAVDRARNAIKSLMALAPEVAELAQADGSWLRLPVHAVTVGGVVRVRPGERLPLDGAVLRGQSAVDQSPVTGESLSVEKSPGDAVYAGSINQTAALEIRVTATASESSLARIIHAVEEAQAMRAPTQRFVDRFATVYTPTVFALALAVALLAPWLIGWSWPQALYKALVLLVIACPCALVISTPVTVVSGLATAARRGILIKGGVYLENARNIRAVALDKTGTITEGKPRLVAFEVFATGADATALRQLAKSLAARSDHPVSAAIAAGLPEPTLAVDGFQALAGRGVAGRIAGHDYALANHRWIEDRGQCSTALEARLNLHEEAGRTVSLLADGQQVLAICAVADTIKPSSQLAVTELQSLRVTPVMLTGDNLATARTVAAQAGITELRANLLPEDKLDAIAELQQRYGMTAMAGDGINDAPALAKADIGFAMGAAGTHAAMEAADVLVMNDDLRRLPETIRLSQRTHTVLWQNIGLALGIKLLFLLLALFDNASMWMAVFADMGASLLVVVNGLRLTRQR